MIHIDKQKTEISGDLNDLATEFFKLQAVLARNKEMNTIFTIVSGAMANYSLSHPGCDFLAEDVRDDFYENFDNYADEFLEAAKEFVQNEKDKEEVEDHVLS